MSLRRTAARGATWTGASTVSTTALQLIQLAALAHLLPREAFGLLSMVMIVLGFSQPFADMGMSNAIIQRQEATKSQLSTLYWLNIFAGVLVYAILLFTIPLITRFFKEPRLAEILQIAICTYLIIPIGQQFRILLQKELRFRTLAMVEMASTVVGTVVTLVAAILGYGVVSIIYGQLVNVSLKSLLFCKIGWRTWRPQLCFRPKELDGFVSFGLFQMGERSINYLAANLDYVFIGRFLGAEALGIYSIAYQLIILPLQKFNPILTRVAFPVFAMKQNDDVALRRGYMELTKILLMVVLPCLVGLAVVAPTAIPVVLGTKWQASIAVTQILVMVGIIKALTNPVGSIWLAKGRADLGFKWNVFVVTANALVFWLSVKSGILAVAWAYVFVSAIHFVLICILLKRMIDLDLRHYSHVFKKPICATIAMVFVVQLVYLVTQTVAGPNVWELTALVVSGAAAYVFVLFNIEREFIGSLFMSMRAKG